MKSLEDFRNNVTMEGDIATSDFKVVANTDGTTRKVRKGRLSFGKDLYPKYIGIPPAVGEIDPALAKESLTEAKKEKTEPPFVLVLKRQGIRYYPNNTKIALYYSDKIKQHFSVPYSDNGYGSPIQSVEELTPAMITLYESLSDINKEKMLESLVTDFEKIKDFAENWFNANI